MSDTFYHFYEKLNHLNVFKYKNRMQRMPNEGKGRRKQNNGEAETEKQTNEGEDETKNKDVSCL